METNDLEQISQVLNEFYRNVTLFSQDLMESLKVRTFVILERVIYPLTDHGIERRTMAVER